MTNQNIFDTAYPEYSGDRMKILLYAQDKFFSGGFHKTSMDEIAREMQISKGTLYKYFPSKLDIVNDAVKMLISGVKSRVDVLISTDANAVEKFMHVIKLLTATITRFSDKWLSDLRHHAPHIWMKVDETRKVLLYENISKIIRQGQKEDLIKKYPPELIITLFTGAIRNVVNPDFLISTRLSYDEAVRHTFSILLGGVLTKKGHVILNKIQK
jgi:AcrR family transcriptional regulator